MIGDTWPIPMKTIELPTVLFLLFISIKQNYLFILSTFIPLVGALWRVRTMSKWEHLEDVLVYLSNFSLSPVNFTVKLHISPDSSQSSGHITAHSAVFCQLPVSPVADSLQCVNGSVPAASRETPVPVVNQSERRSALLRYPLRPSLPLWQQREEEAAITETTVPLIFGHCRWECNYSPCFTN